MQLEVDFQVTGATDVIAQLGLLPELWKVRTRQMMLEWGADIGTRARVLSPEDKIRFYDSRRRPKTQAFKAGWRMQVRETGTDIALEIGNVDPKMPVIVGPSPAKSNVTAKNKDYLVFYWERLGRWVIAKSIDKPATPGQPVHEWAIKDFDVDRHLPDMASRLVA